jgi:DNA processing protein
MALKVNSKNSVMAFSFENPHENINFASENELPYIVALIRSEKIGPISFYDAITKYGSPKNAYSALQEKAKSSNRKVCSIDDAKKEIEQSLKNKAKIISAFSSEYPRILANINDAPPVITCKGNWQKLNEANGIAIVGARNASALARKLSETFASELAAQNLCVVSGLARGIDFAAHNGALKMSGGILPTIGVIAGGIDNIYPKENAKLYEEIAEKGVIISENALGALPKTESFPRRNRIISGLSCITILVEAALKSGSLITARFANEQGREVACVPGFPLDPRSGGTNMLIKNGANLVENTEDILAIYNSISNSYIPRTPKVNVNKVQQEMELPSTVQHQAVQTNADEILNNLSTTPISVDELVKQTGANVAELNSTLLEYELEGKITRHAGGKYSKVV